MRILGLNGSLRRDSYNGELLRLAGTMLGSRVELALFDGLADVPAYNQDADVEPAPVPVRRLREAIADANGVLIASPEYNASIPGALKNALDWASRPFPDNVLREKPVAVVGASTSLFGAVWAQAELRKVLAAIGSRVVEEEVPVPRAHEVFPDGDLPEELRARLALGTRLPTRAHPRPDRPGRLSMIGGTMAELRAKRSRVLAERDSAGVRVSLVSLEGTPDVWLELQDPRLEHPLVVAVAPARALDAFRHPYVYASRVPAVEP